MRKLLLTILTACTISAHACVIVHALYTGEWENHYNEGMLFSTNGAFYNANTYHVAPGVQLTLHRGDEFDVVSMDADQTETESRGAILFSQVAHGNSVVLNSKVVPPMGCM